MVFYTLHHRYRPGDYETWKNIAPIQRAAWRSKVYAEGTWGGEIRAELAPQAVAAALALIVAFQASRTRPPTNRTHSRLAYHAARWRRALSSPTTHPRPRS